MGRFVGLVAGIGPATHARMSMADLRAGCEAEGLAEVRTVLATGNVLCRAALHEADVVAVLRRVLARFGVGRAVYARTVDELAAVAEANPSADAARLGPSRLLVHFLATPCAAGPARDGPERIAVRGREALLDYRDGVGGSRLTGAALNRLLGQPGPARSWNTLGRLVAAGRADA